MSDGDDNTEDDDGDGVTCYRNRFHEITDKWIREHRQEYRGNRAGDIQDAYLDRINAGEEHFSSEVTPMMINMNES